jgi:hypothetical protein
MRIEKFGIMDTKFRNKIVRYDHASDIDSGLVIIIPDDCIPDCLDTA